MSIEHKQSLTSAPQRVALVTAGSAGLGAQIARVLAPDFRVVRHSGRSCGIMLTCSAVHQLHEQRYTSRSLDR
jgi:NAD(P)-dependent dehydrogenase (short-subunit alcohol dehydrogenase family)